MKEPTPWCAAMMVVPKDGGTVRICVDLKPLNESVLREVHPIPKVDTTLAQLSGSTAFSKLDANSRFWQIPLAAESRLLMTFITTTKQRELHLHKVSATKVVGSQATTVESSVTDTNDNDYSPLLLTPE